LASFRGSSGGLHVPVRMGNQLTGDAAHDAGMLAAVDLRLRLRRSTRHWP
jgi:hypothetical protein